MDSDKDITTKPLKWNLKYQTTLFDKFSIDGRQFKKKKKILVVVVIFDTNRLVYNAS